MKRFNSTIIGLHLLGDELEYSAHLGHEGRHVPDRAGGDALPDARHLAGSAGELTTVRMVGEAYVGSVVSCMSRPSWYQQKKSRQVRLREVS